YYFLVKKKPQNQSSLNFYFESGPPPVRALSQDLIDSFEPGDLRRLHWVGEVTDGSVSWYYPNKYKQHDFTSQSTEYSILLRMEEIVLIRAEARARISDVTGAAQDLNIIRSRAGLDNSTAVTADEMVHSILNERRWELFTEHGHRFFDLVRAGQANAVLSSKQGWDATDVLLPIPDRELNLNPNLLPQNAGY
ncbi:MAG: RagB/SusD family nutrient uptake outer membrane protein, partial [Pedobacter sp.]